MRKYLLQFIFFLVAEVLIVVTVKHFFDLEGVFWYFVINIAFRNVGVYRQGKTLFNKFTSVDSELEALRKEIADLREASSK